jgi:hypothetical protein
MLGATTAQVYEPGLDVRIRNDGLFTIPRMIDDHRWSLAAAPRTI